MAGPDIGPGSCVAADSAPIAPWRIQTGQNSLSAVAKNFVPQTGQVRASGCADPSDSAFTASAVLERRLAHGSRPESWQPGPRYLPLSCRSLSSETTELNVAEQLKLFTLFVNANTLPPNRLIEHRKAEEKGYLAVDHDGPAQGRKQLFQRTEPFQFWGI
jgi:hypothetical protein